MVLDVFEKQSIVERKRIFCWPMNQSLLLQGTDQLKINQSLGTE